MYEIRTVDGELMTDMKFNNGTDAVNYIRKWFDTSTPYMISDGNEVVAFFYGDATYLSTGKLVNMKE